MKGKPCYLRCGVVKVKEVHSIRLKYIDTGLPNWCAIIGSSWILGSHCSPGRKQILDSKSYKCLQELNLILDKRATLLDDKRATLAKVLQDHSVGMILEQTLYELCADLTVLEAQDVVLRQQITQETQKLNQLEQKVGRIPSCCFELLILPDIDRVYLCWRQFSGA